MSRVRGHHYRHRIQYQHMKEKNWQSIFNQWVREKYKRTAAFELKQTKTKSIPFSAVKDHQALALVMASDQGLVYKIPDSGFQNPFDCFSLFRVPAFVVIKYPESFELIPIENFLHEKSKSKRKSLTYERAQAISTISIKI